METFFLAIYNIIVMPLFLIGFRIGALFNKKMKQGIEGRRNFDADCKALSAIPADAEVVFFHSSSVGEWEQAVPIITELKQTRANIFVVASFFSPSGFNIVKNKNIDLKIYLPFDTRRNAQKFFSVVKPKVWIISKYDIWPNFLCEAHRNNVPVILASAELAPDSNRHKGLAKYFNRSFYKYFDYVMPVSEDYGKRFLNIYPYQDRIIVAGDARYDQIYRKTQAVIENKDFVPVFESNSGINLICGSIWPTDEKVIFPALDRLLQKYSQLQLILVPHELSPAHINAIDEYFSSRGYAVDRYSKFYENGTTKARIAIIDAIGILFKVYSQTQLAYVGGSFGSGVHNVLEPAAYGQPVVFGPRHKNSFEARQLVKLGCCFTISTEQDAESIFDKLISDNNYREQKGTEAQAFLKTSLGATSKIMSLLNEKYL